MPFIWVCHHLYKSVLENICETILIVIHDHGASSALDQPVRDPLVTVFFFDSLQV